MPETNFDKAVSTARNKIPELMPDTLKETLTIAEDLVKKARFNEAIMVIDGLDEKVKNMHIASRFSDTRTMRQGQTQEVHPDMMDKFLDMSEAEFKREQLLRDLSGLRTKIISLTSQIHEIVLDIEATQRD